MVSHTVQVGGFMSTRTKALQYMCISLACVSLFLLVLPFGATCSAPDVLHAAGARHMWPLRYCQQSPHATRYRWAPLLQCLFTFHKVAAHDGQDRFGFGLPIISHLQRFRRGCSKVLDYTAGDEPPLCDEHSSRNEYVPHASEACLFDHSISIEFGVGRPYTSFHHPSFTGKQIQGTPI